MLASNMLKADDFSAQVLLEIEKSLQHEVEAMRCVDPLREAIAYSLFPGGKRIRPLLAALFCADLQGDWRKIVTPSCALEFVHSASLIHDDLPSMDNDDMRRGKPSCHKAFGESTALVAADLMMPQSMLILARSALASEEKLLLIECLGQAFADVCSGQELDMLAPESRGDLLKIHTLKTGALFGASFVFGAVGAGLSESTRYKASLSGIALGVAFQIVDDYLDQYGSLRETGRAESSDKRNKKLTYFSHCGKEEGNQALQRACDTLMESLRVLEESVAQEKGRRIVLEYTRSIAHAVIGRAK